MSTPSPDSPDSCGMILRPVGFVRNAVQEPFLVAGRDGISMREEAEASRDHVKSVKEAISEIVIDENRVALLDGIEEYSHVTVLYWGHRVPEESRSVDRVHPMGRTDIPKMGIFSTCSPARPNRVQSGDGGTFSRLPDSTPSTAAPSSISNPTSRPSTRKATCGSPRGWKGS